MGGPCEIEGEEAPPCTDNFQVKPFVLDGVEWVSCEQCFQAYKYLDKTKQESIRQMKPRPGDSDADHGVRCWQAGQERMPIRPDWDIVKVEVMYRINRAKYAQNPDEQKALLATGTGTITHPDGGVWGHWNPLIQMRIREELLRSEERRPGVLADLDQQFQHLLEEGGGPKLPLPELASLSPEGGDKESASETTLISLFDRFDTDGDGTIDGKDLARVLQAIDAETWTDARVSTLVKAMDANGDNVVVFDEFLAWAFADRGGEVSAVTGLFDAKPAAESRGDMRRWMLHYRPDADNPRTSLRAKPGKAKDFLPGSVVNGEVVEVLALKDSYANVGLALSNTTGWLNAKYLQNCPEGTAHDRGSMAGDMKRVELESWDGRLKQVRSFLRKRNITRAGRDIRAEKVWFLTGHFLGDVGMATGPKETVFYGCSDLWVDSIVDKGFDEIFDSASGEFGKGLHFSPQSCKAFLECESYMLICEVALGTQDERLTLTAPWPELDYREVCEKQGKLSAQCIKGRRFTHDVRVVYHPSQCKPVYLLKLERAGLYAYRGLVSDKA